MTIEKNQPSDLRNYIDKTGDLPPDVLLGRIVFNTIYDTEVKHADMVRWFEELNLDPAYLPSQNRAQDAFKKATSEAKDVYPMSKGREGHCLSRDVTRTVDYERRQITREIKDVRNKVLSYDRAIDATFYKPTDPKNQTTSRLKIQINSEVLEAGEVDQVKAVAKGIWARYQRYFNYLDGQKLRATVRNYLKHLNAIEIKGGVYFVHATKDTELAALSELVSRIGGGSKLKTIPLIDLDTQREWITQEFEREASEALNRLTEECKQMMAEQGSITPVQWQRMQARYDETMGNAGEHLSILQVSQDVTAAAAELAQRALFALQERALEG